MDGGGLPAIPVVGRLGLPARLLSFLGFLVVVRYSVVINHAVDQLQASPPAISSSSITVEHEQLLAYYLAWKLGLLAMLFPPLLANSPRLMRLAARAMNSLFPSKDLSAERGSPLLGPTQTRLSGALVQLNRRPRSASSSPAELRLLRGRPEWTSPLNRTDSHPLTNASVPAPTALPTPEDGRDFDRVNKIAYDWALALFSISVTLLLTNPQSSVHRPVRVVLYAASTALACLSLVAVVGLIYYSIISHLSAQLAKVQETAMVFSAITLVLAVLSRLGLLMPFLLFLSVMASVIRSHLATVSRNI